MNDDEKVKKFLAEKGATQLPAVDESNFWELKAEQGKRLFGRRWRPLHGYFLPLSSPNRRRGK